MRAPLSLLLVAIGLCTSARAHDFNPGVLALSELSPNEHRMAWTEPVDSRGLPGGVTVRFPDGCRVEADLVSCDEALRGEIAFDGMHDPAMQIVVSLASASGIEEHLVLGAQPAVIVGGGDRSASLWLRLGIEHILGGLDHLAFVLGLLLVLRVRADRRLLATLTAFTLAHSLTLALASLDVVRLPTAPVEATIALSVLLVAREASHERETAMRRAPWLVAAVFGLVHGLGFAGALADIGLPRDALWSSLLFFNVGVELGQLVVVAVVIALVKAASLLGLARDHASARFIHALACTAIGALAAYWLIERTLAMAA